MRSRLIALALLAACSRSDEDERLPPATSWSDRVDEAAGESSRGAAARGSGAHGGGDPHAGLDMGGGDPHAGLDMGGGDPHAGLDMGGGDPHAGLDMGGDPAMAGLQPPDPDRPIDDSKFLRGRIRAAAQVAEHVQPGAILFLSARPIDPATGTILGQPVAVARIDLAKLPVPFALTEADSMIAGTSFEGDVELYARVDGDGEASRAAPGDVEGRLRTRIPAEGLQLVLDTLVE